MSQKVFLLFVFGWIIICCGCSNTNTDFKTWKVETIRVGGVSGGWTSSIESDGSIVVQGKMSKEIKVDESDLKKIKDLIVQLDLPNTNPNPLEDSPSCCDFFGATDQYVEFTAITLDDKKFSSNKLGLTVFQRITLWRLEQTVSDIYKQAGSKIWK